MAETNKGKTWRGNSSSSEESVSPSEKKAKVVTQMTWAFLPLREIRNCVPEFSLILFF